jgi:hypothetical protein
MQRTGRAGSRGSAAMVVVVACDSAVLRTERAETETKLGMSSTSSFTFSWN